MGTYQTFATGGEAVGGMMTKVPELPLAMWLYYFNVDAIDAAMERVTQNGGKVLMGPQQVPTGQWIVQCLDPQGAMFALLAAGR
jgi:predicted enzyme related to lactoylglutathione lyase